MNAKNTSIRTEISVETVESLIARVKRGQIRIPAFQRPLRWKSTNVVALLDSVYRGYPIGTLLLQQGEAEAADLRLGPLTIIAPASKDILWVIDGQQRLIALAASLTRSMPLPTTPDDSFVVYFDALNELFLPPPRNGNIPTTWVPLPELLDISLLIEWVFNWQHGQDSTLRTVVFEASTRLRQYEVTLCTIGSGDETTALQVFSRLNTSGISLSWEEIHQAFLSKEGEYPATVEDLAEALDAERGMGRLSKQNLLACLIASKGLDPTRRPNEHSREGKEKLKQLRHAVYDALPVISRVLNFLRNDAEIPHVLLLPLALPMVVLTRYFNLFPQPSERSLQLLVRWTWRVLLGGALFDERTILRPGVLTLKAGNDEEQARQLLRLIPNDLPEQFRYQLPARFDARAAESRLALLGMYSLHPLLDTGEPVSLLGLLASRKEIGLRKILSSSNSELMTSPANRILLPGARPTVEQQALFAEDKEGQYQRGTSYERLLRLDYAANKAFFTSHAIDELAFEALQQNNDETFLQRRRDSLQATVRRLGDRLAAWGQSDRVSIERILAGAHKIK